jgi:copper(I)-binding protein
VTTVAWENFEMRQRTTWQSPLLGALVIASLAVGCGSAPERNGATPPPDTRRATEGAPSGAKSQPEGELEASAGRLQLMSAVGAGYLKIVNQTNEEHRLVGVETPVASAVTLHETMVEDGVVRMREREDGFVIPSGEELLLEPGGKHLMLRGVALADGQRQVNLTLTFANHPPVDLDAHVIGAGQTPAPQPVPGAPKR